MESLPVKTPGVWHRVTEWTPEKPEKKCSRLERREPKQLFGPDSQIGPAPLQSTLEKERQVSPEEDGDDDEDGANKLPSTPPSAR